MKTKKTLTLSIFILISVVAFSWGYITNSKKVFPHNLIKKVINGNNEVNSKLNTMWAKKVIDGLGMLINQAVPAFEMWHNTKVTVSDTLRRSALIHLERKT